mmetsp:Transcript_104562/g.278210  ORF Transcript_104562/g.278210 Transcript_104562/m.278210 type:complete len:254 (+) Transcript_104562:612-1373(+)
MKEVGVDRDMLDKGSQRVARSDDTQRLRTRRVRESDHHTILVSPGHAPEGVRHRGAGGAQRQLRPRLHDPKHRHAADLLEGLGVNAHAAQRPCQVQGREDADEAAVIRADDKMVARALAVHVHPHADRGLEQRRGGAHVHLGQPRRGQPGKATPQPEADSALRRDAARICEHHVVLRHHAHQVCLIVQHARSGAVVQCEEVDDVGEGGPGQADDSAALPDNVTHDRRRVRVRHVQEVWHSLAMLRGVPMNVDA